MFFLLAADPTSLISKLSDEFLPAVIASAGTLLTGYIIIRERILKNEIKTEGIYEHLAQRDQLIENKIKELQMDIVESKEINKEMAQSLNENTIAIRELKAILGIIKEMSEKSIKSKRKEYDEEDEKN